MDEDIVSSLLKGKGWKHRESLANSSFVVLFVWRKGSLGKFIDLTGKIFGRLTVLHRADDYISPKSKKPRAVWHCICTCGKETDVLGENLKRGNTISCGCEKKKTGEKVKIHGQTDSRLYAVWCSMKSRCSNPKVPEYRLYGARGIDVCHEWLTNFCSFLRWAMENGYDPSSKRGECTIDRIDNNKGYCPENCRIATQKEQMNNVRYNRLLEFNGKIHTLSEWGDIVGKSPSVIRTRIERYGYSIEDALYKPLRSNSKQNKH